MSGLFVPFRLPSGLSLYRPYETVQAANPSPRYEAVSEANEGLLLGLLGISWLTFSVEPVAPICLGRD